MYKFVIIFCVSFIFFSCEKNESVDLNSELELRSEKFLFKGSTIVIGTICPECPPPLEGSDDSPLGLDEGGQRNPDPCFEPNENGEFVFSFQIESSESVVLGQEVEAYMNGVSIQVDFVEGPKMRNGENSVKGVVTVSQKDICGSSYGDPSVSVPLSFNFIGFNTIIPEGQSVKFCCN